jgi:hypothetical protein
VSDFPWDPAGIGNYPRRLPFEQYVTIGIAVGLVIAHAWILLYCYKNRTPGKAYDTFDLFFPAVALGGFGGALWGFFIVAAQVVIPGALVVAGLYFWVTRVVVGIIVPFLFRSRQ